MKPRFALLLAGLLALAGCDSAPDADGDRPPPSPILYEVLDQNGATEGWLFGTIHALPDGTKWRTDGLDEAVAEADFLVVEIANLGDTTELAQLFSSLATSPNQPEIGQRVPISKRPALFDLIRRSDYNASDFGAVETWAAALMLAQVSSIGEAENGADRALLRDFAGRRIVELEGAEKQLGIFDSLPESEQSDLLLGVIEETDQRNDDPERLQRAWLYGEEPELERATTRGIMADHELRDALLINRNVDWDEQLADMLERGPRPLVAVGAAHLVGPDGLPALLRERGYEIRRIR